MTVSLTMYLSDLQNNPLSHVVSSLKNYSSLLQEKPRFREVASLINDLSVLQEGPRAHEAVSLTNDLSVLQEEPRAHARVAVSLTNDLSVLQEEPRSQKQKKYKVLKDWSMTTQCSGSKSSGVSIPARKHATAIVLYHPKEKIIFAFNMTYAKQIQLITQDVSKKMEKYVSDSEFKIWSIKPYRGQWEGAEKGLEHWIASKFPKANVENIKLEKNHHFTIDRENGYGKQEYKAESFFKKNTRRMAKACLVLSSKENVFTSSF